MIYLIALDEHALCKVGSAVDVEKRFKSLRTANPFPLRLVKTREGGVKLERAIHRRMQHARVRGEWFHLTPELLEAFDSTEQEPEAIPLRLIWDDPAQHPMDRLFAKAKEHHVPMAHVCARAEVDHTTPSRWRRGISRPSADKLYALEVALDQIINERSERAA